MYPDKIKRLEEKGWRVGTVKEFLDLTPEESRYIELKLALHIAVCQAREESGLTQAELAKRMGSSQSRVARMEGGDPQVSIDLLLRALIALGMTSADLAETIAQADARS